MSEDKTDSVAVQEAKKQTVILAFSIVGAVILVSIASLEHDAAARQRFVMHSALCVKRIAQANADWWQSVAAKAATVYNRNRM